MKNLFGTDGIRGKANTHPLTIDICIRLSEVLVKKFCDECSEKIVIVGKDTRISSDMFEYAIAASLSSFGVNVKLIDVCPTPAVSILTNTIGANFGIMISASHNSFSDNGIKIFNKFGFKLSDEEELEIESMISDTSIKCSRCIGEKIGKIQKDIDFISLYTQKIKFNFSFKTEFVSNIKVVLDSANGSLSKIAPKIFQDFGFNIISTHDDPNGININDRCGVMHQKEISTLVLQNNADIGIAFDGDGDRLILSDEFGKILDGNYILAALSELYSLENTNVISTIMANYGLEEYLKTKNIQLIRTNVGDRYISESMRETGTILGGESSGHIILKEHAMTGDGLFTALKILEYLVNSKKRTSEIWKLFEKSPCVSKNIKVNDKSIIYNAEILKCIEKLKKKLNGHGKLIVRPSGTEELIRVTAEGNDKNELHQIVDELCKIIAGVKRY